MTSDIHENLYQLWLTNTGCDVVLQIGPKSFFAHRVVLMAQIEYFRNMLVMDFREKKELVIPLDPEIVDSTFFEEILKYIYTSKIAFTDENIRPIYRVADYLCFDKLSSEVIEHMKSNMDVENVVFYKTVAIEFGLEALKEDCHQFIIQNLSSDIQREQLIPILLLEDLNEILQKLKQTGKLEEMFHYSIDWIVHNKHNSAGKLLELLKNIPLKSLSYNFLKQVVSQNDLIRNNIECFNLVFDAFSFASDSCLKEAKERFDKPRTDSIFVFGGFDGLQLTSVSEYNSLTHKWTATTPMPSPRSHMGTVVIGHKIHVCGGHDGKQNTNELMVFDTHSRTWTQLRPMNQARQQCVAAVLNGQIYVAGGEHGSQVTGGRPEMMNVVERYCIATDKWEYVEPMTTKRTGLRLEELNGFLYAIGGFDGRNGLNTVERYDPVTNKWTLMDSRMNNAFGWFGSAVLNGYIYVASKDKCEVYSSEDDRWIEIPAPSINEWGRRLAAYEGQLYTMGGQPIGENNDWKGIKTVEVFDMQARVWRPEPDMDVARCFHGVAVVK